MTSDSPRFAMVAGEASGDVLAGSLLASLRARWPALTAAGIGGPRMAEQGFEAWWPHDKLSLLGYIEVLGHFREILAIRSQLVERLLRDKPDAFIGVDAPDFNLDVEMKLKAAGIKTIHFISPSIWAWRGKRIEKIGKATDLVLCIFPFEPEIYAKRKINAVYVGHPLASAIPFEVPRAASRAALGIADDETLVALLPGSRRSEIQYIAPRLFARGGGDEPGPAGAALRRAGRHRPAPRGRAAAQAVRARRAPSRCSTAAPTRRSPPATSRSSRAARRRSRRRSSSGRWSSSTPCTH